MAIMDPLLNTGFLWRCLAAYAGIKADDEAPHDDLEEAVEPASKRRKLERTTSTSEPTSNASSEYIRGDTYYTQLGTAAYRKMRLEGVCFHIRRYHGLAASSPASKAA